VRRALFAALPVALLGAGVIGAVSARSEQPSSRASAAGVYFSEFFTLADLRMRPTSIHGGSDFGWTGVSWQQWGGATAGGQATYYFVNKENVPYVREEYPVSLRVSRVRRCLEHRYYSRMVSTFLKGRPQGAPATESISYPCPRVYYVPGVGARFYRPRTVFFGAHSAIVRVHWFSWGGRRARGTGLLEYNDCLPFCARGHITRYRVHLTLSDRGFCDAAGELAYRRLVYRYTRRKPQGPPRVESIGFRRYPCSVQ